MNYYWLTVSLTTYVAWVTITDLTLTDFLVPVALIAFGYSFVFDKKKKEVKNNGF
jgi:hypothetical protein